MPKIPRSLWLALLLSTCTFAGAQADRPAGYPPAELFGSFFIASTNPLGTNKGFKLGADFRLHGPFYLVAEQSQFFDLRQNYPGGSKARDTSLLAGPQYRYAKGHFSYFADFLAGENFYHNYGRPKPIYPDSSVPALATGGGVDISLSRELALRGEAEYFLTRLTNDASGGPPQIRTRMNKDRSRFSVDVVYRF